MNWKILRKKGDVSLDSSTVAWNIAIDAQVWITIAGVVALAILRPDFAVTEFVTLLLVLNIAVAVGSTHKEMLKRTIRQESELQLLRAALKEIGVAQTYKDAAVAPTQTWTATNESIVLQPISSNAIPTSARLSENPHTVSMDLRVVRALSSLPVKS